MEEVTLHVKLKAKHIDLGDYITYVFENLDTTNINDKYVMCVQFPNWNQAEIKINDVGYVNLRYVKEGVSKWYDGEKLNVYKYTNMVFLRFIEEPHQVNNEFVVD